VKRDPGKEDGGIGASERKVTQREGSSASCGREAGRNKREETRKGRKRDWRQRTNSDGKGRKQRQQWTGKNPGKEGSGIGASEQKVTEKERSSAPTVNEKRKKQHPREGQTNIPDLRIKP
jgi:hypothetical protein